MCTCACRRLEQVDVVFAPGSFTVAAPLAYTVVFIGLQHPCAAAVSWGLLTVAWQPKYACNCRFTIPLARIPERTSCCCILFLSCPEYVYITACSDARGAVPCVCVLGMQSREWSFSCARGASLRGQAGVWERVSCTGEHRDASRNGLFSPPPHTKVRSPVARRQSQNSTVERPLLRPAPRPRRAPRRYLTHEHAGASIRRPQLLWVAARANRRVLRVVSIKASIRAVRPSLAQ